MLSDKEVTALLGQELAFCDTDYLGGAGSYHSDRRARNLALYFGEPLGTEVENQSSWVSRDSLEAVEAAMPELLRAFADAKQSVAFIPTEDTAEAVKKADEETDAVRHVFFQHNPGFLNLYEWTKTALIQYNGYLRCERGTQTRYRTRELTLTEQEFEALNADPAWELKGKPRVMINGEFAEPDQGFTPGVDIVAIRARFKESIKSKRVRIEGVAPENMLVTLRHRSIDLIDCSFVAERMSDITPTDLKRMGVADDVIERLPDYNPLFSAEEAARMQGGAVVPGRVSTDRSMRQLEVFRCFIEMDYEENGEAERYEVWMGGNEILLPVKPVDYHPYFAITPNIVPFRHQGQGYPDLLEHTTLMKSAAVRGIADAVYHTSNPRPIINVNMRTDTTEEDVATNLPGYSIRVDGPPDQAISHQKHAPLPNDVFTLVEYLDGAKEDMVGHGHQTSLAPDQIAQANTGVVWAATEAKKGKIELIARIMAQVGLRAVFLRIHELLRDSRRGFMARIGGQMKRANPSTWIYREDMEVMVGLGSSNRDKQAVGAKSVLEIQEKMVQMGGLGTTVDMTGIYNASAKLAESFELGFADQYFIDPIKAAAGEINEERAKLMEQTRQAQNQPSDTDKLVQAQMKIEQEKSQVQIEKLKVEMAKLQAQLQLDTREQQMKETDMVLDHQEERAKIELAYEKNVPGSAV